MTRWSWLIALVLLVGCSSEKRLKQELADYVTSRRACATTDDCVLVSSGCPLACGTAVARKYQSDVQRKARELSDDYGKTCNQDCPKVAAVCEAGSCTEQAVSAR